MSSAQEVFGFKVIRPINSICSNHALSLPILCHDYFTRNGPFSAKTLSPDNVLRYYIVLILDFILKNKSGYLYYSVYVTETDKQLLFEADMINVPFLVIVPIL